LALGAAAVLAACAGNGVVPRDGPSLRAVHATVTVKFPRPKHHRRKHGRDPLYVSASTTSVTFTLTAVDGGVIPAGYTTTKTVALAFHGSNAACTYASGAQTYTCTTSWTVPAASDSFTVDAYDASSKLLSTNALTQAVSTGSSNIAVTLWGVPASIALTSSSTAVSGTQASGFSIQTVATPYPFTVTVDDADGNVIVGPGAPSYAVSFGSANFTATTPAPGADTFTITPLGSSAYRPDTVTVTAVFPTGGPTPYPSTCPSAACQASASISTGVPFFSSDIAGSVSVYSVAGIASALGGTASVAKFNTVAIGSGSPYGVTFDAAGDMFVSTNGTVGYAYTAATVKAFLSGSAVTASGTLKLVGGGQDSIMDAAGDLFVSAPSGTAVSVFSSTALASALAGGAGVLPTGSLAVTGANNLTFDPSGNLFVTGGTVVTVFSAAKVASAAAGATNVAASGALSVTGSNDVTSDAAGNVFVGASSTTISVFSKAAIATAVAGSTVAATGSLLSTNANVLGVTFDGSGNLFVPIGSLKTVIVFTKSAVAAAIAGGANEASSGSLSTGTNAPSETYFDTAGDLFAGTRAGPSISVFSATAAASAVGGATNVAASGGLTNTGAWKLSFGP
jgi:hypothetical protein